jgi:dipeptidyl aminopeptidase/acylaminoacyl peptidase
MIEISNDQALNKPPVLTARDKATRAARTLLDPNPQLAGIALGEMAPYDWKDRHGRTIHGGLLKPPGFVAGRRYICVSRTLDRVSGKWA